MWKRYNFERMPLFDSDDNSIGGSEPTEDFTDEISDLFDQELGGVDEPEADDEPAEEPEDDEETQDNEDS